MKRELTTLAQRLGFIAGDRKPHTWAKAIGVPKISIENVMKGSSLSGDTLAHIHRVENVRIDWLLQGRGHPYAINCVITDDGALDLLEDLLQEEWHIDVITDTRHIALILSQPASVEVKDGKTADGEQQYRSIGFRIIEVICGAIGPRTMARVWQQADLGRYIVSSDDMTRIQRGHVGTYKLYTAPDAILTAPFPTGIDDAFINQLAEPQLQQTTPDEKALLGYYRAMSESNRLAVNQVAVSMAEHGERPKLKRKNSQ